MMQVYGCILCSMMLRNDPNFLLGEISVVGRGRRGILSVKEGRRVTENQVQGKNRSSRSQVLSGLRKQSQDHKDNKHKNNKDLTGVNSIKQVRML